MPYISTISAPLAELPPGRITIRWRSSRNVFQCYAGSAYLDGASGDEAEDAARALVQVYSVKPGTSARVYGFKNQVMIKL